ncbi:alpha/beta fold hydrolase [Portibacter lacus]|uniref:Oxidoreductase n=1 Tax=Portibacter lacus TaxID=1099794 RepID=A0AA37WGB4_9BACT|nr:alpha/beta hydrolase [Portibacter lacus]GLR19542.1 oxidoreductase [Portibacter lacus]
MIKITNLIFLILMTTAAISQVPKKSELVHINGKKIYYEAYGEGSPLILLHGYTQSSISWKPYVKDFENEYEVYIIDLTGHGQSEPFKEELSIKSVAHDLDALIQYLQLEKVKAIGFSFGGDVLYQLALINPPLVTSMITIGAVGTWSIKDFPDYLQAFTFENRNNFPWLQTLHKGDEQIIGMMEQFKNYTVRLSDLDLQTIKPEVLIMVGDNDEGMDFIEVFRAKKNLPKSDLWVLPNVAHGAHEGETREEFIIKANAFLSKF